MAIIASCSHDRGGEYTSNVFKALCLQSGIIQELTEAYSPQQNGVAERANRTLVEHGKLQCSTIIIYLYHSEQRPSGQQPTSGTDVQQADWAL